TIYGDGSQTRSFCYVDDLIEGIVRLMGTEASFTGPVNIGNPEECTMRQLAELIVKLTGSKSQLVYRSLPADDPKQRCPDVSLAAAHLKWSPRVPLEDGLMRVIDYFSGLQ